METARLPPARYYQHYPPPAPFIHDLHPALLHQYISFYSEPITPLDLSVKPTPCTPPCTPPPKKTKQEDRHQSKIFRHFEEVVEKSEPEPEKKKQDENDNSQDSNSPEVKKLKFTRQFFEDLKSCLPKEPTTPTQNDRDSPDVVEVRNVDERPKKSPPKIPAITKKSKVVRRLQFDEDKTSPVSGTIIRDLAEDETLVVRKGDIDPAFNVVEVTEEAKALIAGIDNRIGRYICRLCRKLYPDAFALAQHRCERIVHIEYRCPECDKVFNCPANLASHRRWHKPRVPGASKTIRRQALADPTPLDPNSEGNKFACKVCGKIFRRQAYLRKHYLAHEAAGKDSVTEPERVISTIPEDDISGKQYPSDEHSAFRQVRSEHLRNYHSEPLRDDNYNTFWGKTHRSDFSFTVDPYYDKHPEAIDNSSANYVSSLASSVHSDDSRSLDITGSEDEGSGGRRECDAGDGN